VSDPVSGRPLCAEVSAARAEPLTATASRVEHWLLVECDGRWPHEPMDSAIFANGLRSHLISQLARLPRSRLLLIKPHPRALRGGVRVLYGYTRERARSFFSLEIDHHADLLELDLADALLGGAAPPGEPLEQPLLLVCTHGVRDRCCARYGQALFRAAHRVAPELTWQASHVGGDRFAGNLVALPEGLCFGRVAGDHVDAVFGEYAAGRIALDWYRGASCYPMRVQAAEHAVRRVTGLTGFHDLRFAGHDGDRVRMRAETTGELHEVEVGQQIAPDEAFLTCAAERPRRARHFVARSHAIVG
jgi:hypothetical protein